MMSEYQDKNKVEKEVASINLSNLFSVYGPKSQQMKKRPKIKQMGVSSKSISKEDKVKFGLELVEPENHQNHLHLLKSMLIDGSLQNYIFREQGNQEHITDEDHAVGT